MHIAGHTTARASNPQLQMTRSFFCGVWQLGSFNCSFRIAIYSFKYSQPPPGRLLEFDYAAVAQILWQLACLCHSGSIAGKQGSYGILD